MRILIVRLSALGDIVHTLPLADNAHAAGCEVGWLTQAAYAPLREPDPIAAWLAVRLKAPEFCADDRQV